jgi:hypothetical protein
VRVRLIAIAAISGCFSSNLLAQNFLLSDGSKTLAETYLTCVVSEATKLETAGEPISDTVEFGKTACSDHRLQIALGVVRDVNTALPKVSPESALNIIQKLRESVYDQVTAEARLRLAKIRSERLRVKN